jgi:hypothetical protein
MQEETKYNPPGFLFTPFWRNFSGLRAERQAIGI